VDWPRSTRASHRLEAARDARAGRLSALRTASSSGLDGHQIHAKGSSASTSEVVLHEGERV